MTDLERRRSFGMLCEVCGTDVADDAYTGMKSLTNSYGHFSLIIYYCEKCAPESSRLPKIKLLPGY